ncbi:MAG: DUF1801 domain-containing protein [Bacteroidia bacterium]
MKKPPKTDKLKMQNVSFKSVDEFLEFLPENELKIVEFLRQIVLDCIPNCMEKLSYNVPFYKKNKNICFIWPASVTWGNVKQNGVRIGFTAGYLLNDELGYLDKGSRKQVYTKDFMDIKEIDVDLLKAFLFEAVLLDKK